MVNRHPFTAAFPPIPVRPSADEIESFAPEVFALADRSLAVTLAGTTDFDSELFFAVEAILDGKDFAAVVACVTPTHPATAEATALLREAWVRHQDHTAATRHHN